MQKLGFDFTLHHRDPAKDKDPLVRGWLDSAKQLVKQRMERREFEAFLHLPGEHHGGSRQS